MCRSWTLVHPPGETWTSELAGWSTSTGPQVTVPDDGFFTAGGGGPLTSTSGLYLLGLHTSLRGHRLQGRAGSLGPRRTKRGTSRRCDWPRSW